MIELDSIHLNRSWNLFYKEKAEEKEAQEDTYSHMPKMVRYIILACGIVGIFGAYQYRQTSYDTPVLEITKTDALRIGKEACEKQYEGENILRATILLVVSYTLGSFLAPALGGFAMDVSNKNGINLLFFVITSLVFLVFLKSKKI